jgi:hypothetical protein
MTLLDEDLLYNILDIFYTGNACTIGLSEHTFNKSCQSLGFYLILPPHSLSRRKDCVFDFR